jgi:spermidine synthase
LAKSVPYWPTNPKLPISPWLHFLIDFVRAIWAILPPTVFWGASFSLAVAAVTASDADPARPVAAIYAANTSGAIAGALAVGMLLIPHIGTRQSERVLMILSLLSALCALSCVWSRPWRSTARILRFAALIVLAGILVTSVPEIPPQVVAYGRLVAVAGGSRILYVGEGLNSSIAVSQFGNMLQFHVSGKAEASTGAYDMRVQRMLGHLPALLHPNPHTALVVGFGAGVTAGSLAVNPDVQRIVVCEIEPLVPPTTTRYFRRQNYNVLNDHRTKVVFDDARSYILTTREKFDIVTSDPIHPWVKGSAALYTKEYFELVKQHLNPDGVVAQWVPLYETDLASVKSEVATFFDVFPNGTIWGNQGDGEGYDLVLLGQNRDLKVDGDKLQQRLDRPDYVDVARSLREVGLESASKILQTFSGRASDLRPWLSDAEINRDGNLRLQYLAGFAVNSSEEGKIYDEILSYRRLPDGVN